MVRIIGGGSSHQRTGLRRFPVPRENAGKFAYFGLEIAKVPGLSEENSIAYQQNSLVAKAGKISPRVPGRDEIYAAPRSWAEKAYPKLIHYNRLPKGGRFAAWEQPELFTQELRTAFKSLRQ